MSVLCPVPCVRAGRYIDTRQGGVLSLDIRQGSVVVLDTRQDGVLAIDIMHGGELALDTRHGGVMSKHMTVLWNLTQGMPVS